LLNAWSWVTSAPLKPEMPKLAGFDNIWEITEVEEFVLAFARVVTRRRLNAKSWAFILDPKLVARERNEWMKVKKKQ
jgi:uncharacterized protein Usg